MAVPEDTGAADDVATSDEVEVDVVDARRARLRACGWGFMFAAALIVVSFLQTWSTVTFETQELHLESGEVIHLNGFVEHTSGTDHPLAGSILKPIVAAVALGFAGIRFRLFLLPLFGLGVCMVAYRASQDIGAGLADEHLLMDGLAEHAGEGAQLLRYGLVVMAFSLAATIIQSWVVAVADLQAVRAESPDAPHASLLSMLIPNLALAQMRVNSNSDGQRAGAPASTT